MYGDDVDRQFDTEASDLALVSGRFCSTIGIAIAYRNFNQVRRPISIRSFWYSFKVMAFFQFDVVFFIIIYNAIVCDSTSTY